MLDGIYDIVAQTPLGEKKGAVELKGTGGTKLDAAVKIAGIHHTCQGTTDGESFAFDGTAKVMFKKINFKVDGIAKAGKLEATLRVGSEAYAVQGSRR